MNAPGEHAVLCIDIGGTSSKAGVFTAEGELQFVDSIPTAAPRDTFLTRLCNLIERVQTLSRSNLRAAPDSMGVAVAGFLDERRERFVYNSNLAWLEGAPLRERLRQAFPDVHIELEVDSNAATMAEQQLGSGRGSKRFLCVTAGTGLGVGVAIDGVPLRFAYGCLGDIGHIVVDRDGPRCSCGGRGCAEVMVSAPLLAERFQHASGVAGEVTLREVIGFARDGNAAAVAVLRTAGEWLGVALASMSNIFFPDHIAVAGGLSAAGEFVMKPAEEAFRENACVLARSTATLTRATLGSQATLIGAAWPFWRKGLADGGESGA